MGFILSVSQTVKKVDRGLFEHNVPHELWFNLPQKISLEYNVGVRFLRKFALILLKTGNYLTQTALIYSKNTIFIKPIVYKRPYIKEITNKAQSQISREMPVERRL